MIRACGCVNARRGGGDLNQAGRSAGKEIQQTSAQGQYIFTSGPTQLGVWLAVERLQWCCDR